jgi:tRNA dimethylallyltransferase
MGPTASGKSKFSEQIAESLNCRLMNADAFQVYRGMDVGTAKPLFKDRYDLLDLKNPDEDFGVGEFVILAANLLQSYFEQGLNVVLVGGTGFYCRALIEEYKDLSPSPSAGLREELQEKDLEELQDMLRERDPDAYSRVDLMNRIRVSRAVEKAIAGNTKIEFRLPDFQIHKIGILPSVEESASKIALRTSEMFGNGWFEEVQTIIDAGYVESDPGFRAIGYRSIAAHLSAPRDVELLVKEIELETVQYAKRQRTWLRSEPRLETYSNISDAWEWFRSLNLN